MIAPDEYMLRMWAHHVLCRVMQRLHEDREQWPKPVILAAHDTCYKLRKVVYVA